MYCAIEPNWTIPYTCQKSGRRTAMRMSRLTLTCSWILATLKNLVNPHLHFPRGVNSAGSSQPRRVSAMAERVTNRSMAVVGQMGLSVRHIEVYTYLGQMRTMAAGFCPRKERRSPQPNWKLAQLKPYQVTCSPVFYLEFCEMNHAFPASTFIFITQYF